MGTSRATGISLDAMTTKDFPLPGLAATLAGVGASLREGAGIALIRGLPLDAFQRSDIERIFCGLGTYLGTSCSQSHRGDRLGRVIDICEPGRYYSEEQMETRIYALRHAYKAARAFARESVAK